jgi:hypothetical protein
MLAMKRYYFHLVHSTERIIDEEGVELADDGAVALEALQAIAELLLEEPLDQWHEWTLEVTDDEHRLVVSFELSSFMAN